MRAICAWPPASGTGIWDVSFGFAGSVDIDDHRSVRLIRIVVQRVRQKVKPGLGTGILFGACTANAMNLPSGY